MNFYKAWRSWIRVDPQPPAFKPLLIWKTSCKCVWLHVWMYCMCKTLLLRWSLSSPVLFYFIFFALTIHSGLSKQNLINCGEKSNLYMCEHRRYICYGSNFVWVNIFQPPFWTCGACFFFFFFKSFGMLWDFSLDGNISSSTVCPVRLLPIL